MEYSENKYSVTEINAAGDGETYIPVGGYVLSVPESSSFTAKEGDVLTLEGKVTLPEMAVESDKGARVAIDALNSNRSMPMVVYYDYDFGDKTGTNAYGTELSAIFDEESASFEVVSFRGFGVGDGSGIEIPENGFVLSAYGVGYRGIFLENNRFSLGDKLSMVGSIISASAATPSLILTIMTITTRTTRTTLAIPIPAAWRRKRLPSPLIGGKIKPLSITMVGRIRARRERARTSMALKPRWTLRERWWNGG